MNAYAQGDALEQDMKLSDEAKALMINAAETMRLSARSYYRLIRVARTIADLDHGQDSILKPHVAEALSYRKTALL